MIKIPEKDEEAKREEELKARYGVIKEIPKREVEGEEQTVEEVEYPKEEGEVKFHDLILRIEKMDGKLDIIDRFREDMNERVTQLAEEIGELRTMMLERDRAFDKMATNFERVKDTVSGLEPTAIKNEFEKIKTKFLKHDAEIEKIVNLVDALSEENKKFRGLFEKIKSFENLVDISYDIDRKLSKIKEIKDYSDKTAAKVESVFSELNEKVSELEGEREKIKKLDELTIEMAKMLDEMSVKLTKFIEKKDLDELKKSVEEDLDKKLSQIKDVKNYAEKLKKLDELSLKINKFIEKKDLDEFKKNIEEDLEKIKIQPQAKVSTTVPVSTTPELLSELSVLKSTVESHSSFIMNLAKQLEEVRPAKEAQNVRKVMLSLRFFQIMTLLNYVKEPEKIRNYLSELKEIVDELKQNGIWNEEKESFMKEMLDRVSKCLETYVVKRS